MRIISLWVTGGGSGVVWIVVMVVWIVWMSGSCDAGTSGDIIFDHPHDIDCGQEDLGSEQRDRLVQNEVAMFGRPVRDMQRSDFSVILQVLSSELLSNNKSRQNNNRDMHRMMQGSASTMVPYPLVNLPVVYHILPNQNNGSDGYPTATAAQLTFATKVLNRSYIIYDKTSGISVPWATFVQDETIVHNDIVWNQDCATLTNSLIQQIVTKAAEWQFKLHAVICESNQWSGLASLPNNYDVLDPRHNLIRIDYRALACYDSQNGAFLCDPTPDGQDISHSRWWRTQSKVLAHEFGHIFGLLHTFGSNCNQDADDVPDTPAEFSSDTNTCQGLLPYDPNRDLFDTSTAQTPNPGSVNSCGSTDDFCSVGNTCAACCEDCLFYEGLNSVSEEAYTAPYCCTESDPLDSCPNLAGTDPKNNFMAYAPDYCIYEFTPGQLARMMAQVKAYKTLIYCNYATTTDAACANVDCATTATSPLCRLMSTSCHNNTDCEKVVNPCVQTICTPNANGIDGMCTIHGFACSAEQTCILPTCGSCDACNNNNQACVASGCTFVPASSSACRSIHNADACRSIPGCRWRSLGRHSGGVCQGIPTKTTCIGTPSVTCQTS